MAAEASTDSLAGQLVGGRYRLGRRIGKGGMGIVYEAEHVGLDKRVAVKFLLDRFNDDREVIERFHREARNASRIGQDNIIDVTDVGDGSDGRPYIVMEYLDGADLSAVLHQSGPMPARRAVHIIRQVLRGLEAAHSKGIVHRDMKPENVFLVTRGDDRDFVKVMDFGISKVIAANDSKVRLTATGAVIGTPIYMAPEQALAQTELDHRVDLYAVGVMLYELLAGRPPFLAMSYLGLVTQHLNTMPPSLAGFRPDVPPTLVAAVHRALEKDPDNRFQTAAEMARALPPETTLRDMDVAATLGDTDGIRVVTEGVKAAAAARVLDDSGSAAGVGVPPPRRRTATWILVGAVAVAAGMVVVAAATRDHGRAADNSAAPAANQSGGKTEDEQPAPAPGPEIISIGALDVRSTPVGAKVFLDDVYNGQTPVMLKELPSGPHRLRLELDGHQGLSMNVIVSGDRTNIVDEALASLGGPAAAGSGTVKGARSGSAGKGGGSSKGAGKASGDAGKASGDAGKASGDAGKASDDGGKGKGGKGGRPGQKPNPYDD